MRQHSLIGCLAAVALFGVGSIASAQQAEEPANGACFYADINYGGQKVCVETGKDVGYFPDMNDQVSSIKLFGDAALTAYVDAGFRGRSEDITENVADLRGRDLNDVISAVKVHPAVSHAANTGTAANADEANRMITQAYKDVLGREPDAQGLALYRSRMLNENWTGAQVRDALQNSPEYRAREIVRVAYRSVLNREPDPGASVYVDHVLHDNWSESQVENALRNSPEYRTRAR